MADGGSKRRGGGGRAGTGDAGPSSTHTSAPLHLHSVQWRLIPRSSAPELGPAGVTDPCAVAFGFNSSLYAPSMQPPPPPAPVEYDMDEQDASWLRLQNTRRFSCRLPPVSREAFEIIMDRIEREWAVLLVCSPSHLTFSIS